MTALQKTIVTATIAVLAGAGIYEARQAAQLREQVQTLQQQQAPLAEQVQQLQGQRDEATNQMSFLRNDNERLRQNSSDLLRLRGEVAALRRKSVLDEPEKRTALNQEQQAVSFESDENDTAPSGRATTAAAAQSFIWAVHHKDREEMMRSMIAETLDSQSDEALWRFATNSGPNNIIGFSELPVVNTTDSNEARGTVVVYTPAAGPESKKTTFRNIGGEWKLVIYSSRDTNGNISYVGFEKPKP